VAKAQSTREVVTPEINLSCVSAPCVQLELDPLRAQDLQRVLSQVKGELPLFPYRCCKLTAARLAKAYPDFEYAHGIFIADEAGHTYAWNIDRQMGLYVVLMARQFDAHLPEVLIVSADAPWKRDRYIPDHFAVW